jgi:hypothetical protein
MIIFASFIRAALDCDLLPAWVAHYLACRFDRYAVFLHDVPGEEAHTDHAAKVFSDNGFEVNTVGGEYRNGTLQKAALESFHGTLDKNDTLVMADSDEFHDVKPKNYRNLCDEFDAVHGPMVDRWTETGLCRADSRKALNAQYPNSGNLYDWIREQHGLSDPIWNMGIPHEKFLCVKVKYAWDLNGGHGIEGEQPPQDSIMRGVKIMHYTWREGILERMAQKTYFSPFWIGAIANHFNVGEDRLETVKAIIRDRMEKLNTLAYAA